jgi:hypothetical protein
MSFVQNHDLCEGRFWVRTTLPPMPSGPWPTQRTVQTGGRRISLVIKPKQRARHTGIFIQEAKGKVVPQDIEIRRKRV